MRMKPCYIGGKSHYSEWYQQEQDNLTKHLDSFIKGDLGDGKDLCHVTLVSDGGEPSYVLSSAILRCKINITTI